MRGSIYYLNVTPGLATEKLKRTTSTILEARYAGPPGLRPRLCSTRSARPLYACGFNPGRSACLASPLLYNRAKSPRRARCLSPILSLHNRHDRCSGLVVSLFCSSPPYWPACLSWVATVAPSWPEPAAPLAQIYKCCSGPRRPPCWRAGPWRCPSPTRPARSGRGTRG